MDYALQKDEMQLIRRKREIGIAKKQLENKFKKQFGMSK